MPAQLEMAPATKSATAAVQRCEPPSKVMATPCSVNKSGWGKRWVAAAAVLVVMARSRRGAKSWMQMPLQPWAKEITRKRTGDAVRRRWGPVRAGTRFLRVNLAGEYGTWARARAGLEMKARSETVFSGVALAVDGVVALDSTGLMLAMTKGMSKTTRAALESWGLVRAGTLLGPEAARVIESCGCHG